MSMTNQSESDLIKLFFQNIAFTGVGNAGGLLPSSAAGNLYISLHSANPAETGTQASSEATYTGYARLPLVRSAVGWTVSGTAPTQVVNATILEFGPCTAGGQTLSHFGIGTEITGAGKLCFFGALDSPLAVTNGKMPVFDPGDLKVTLD